MEKLSVQTQRKVPEKNLCIQVGKYSLTVKKNEVFFYEVFLLEIGSNLDFQTDLPLKLSSSA